MQDKFESVEQPFNLHAAQKILSRNMEISVDEVSVWKKKQFVLEE